MDRTIAEEYKSSLNDLNFNSKPLINMLTMLADENKKHASLIVSTIITHINSVSPEIKLPGLYLVDSIVKNIGDQYLKIFCQHITSLFSSVFSKVDENTRSLMFKLRQTWTDVLPNKILYNLDVTVKEMDPAWPITAKSPSKRILINPKFLDRSVGEKKESEAPTAILKKEESKIKLKQGEVLKQLLAKQEQLRQLELKKLQLTMKKKVSTSGSSNSSITFKQNHIRDPRMVKINNAPQNISALNASTNSVLQGKLISPVSSTYAQERSTITTQSQVQSNVDNCKKSTNDISSEQNSQISDEQSMPHKKVALKHKNDKCGSNKNKFNSDNKDKVEEVKCISNESAINPVKTDLNYIKNEAKTDKCNEKSRDISKESKSILKRKSPTSDISKVSQLSINTTTGINKKKVPFLKIPKKNEKSKFFPGCLAKARNIDVKIIKHALNEERGNIKKNILKCEPIDISKSVLKTNDLVSTECVQSDVKSIAQKDEDLRTKSISLTEETFTTRVPKREILISDSFAIGIDKLQPPRKKFQSDIESISQKDEDLRTKSILLTEETFTTRVPKREIVISDSSAIGIDKLQPPRKKVQSDIKSISQKDEDLRTKSVSLTEETFTTRVPKREIVISDSFAIGIDKLQPPRKKFKSEDIENCNPDYRVNSTVLFGNEDQDLRQSKNHSVNDVKSKDWTQYKASHPDEYSPCKQDYSGEKFRFQRHQFSNFKHYNQMEYERFGPFKYSRGRYTTRSSARNVHYPRLFLFSVN